MWHSFFSVTRRTCSLFTVIYLEILVLTEVFQKLVLVLVSLFPALMFTIGFSVAIVVYKFNSFNFCFAQVT